MAETTKIEWCDSSVYRPSPMGPAPAPPRDGDAVQARQRVNVLVRTGRLAHPNSLPCADCGHVWSPGGRRHEYDHNHGYEAKHHYCVQSLCTKCHHKKDNPLAQRTHCVRGHELSGENLYLPPAGGRACRECIRMHELRRGPRGSEFWREVNQKRSRRGISYG